MRIRFLFLVAIAAALVLSGCKFGENKELKDPNRDNTPKAGKTTAGDDTSTP